ncbi:hypothetical protein LEN26_010697 [Aphanomyces euteiches]|nr:hypothetical protein LEN26_010697 [Aphanomyces euteiches]KAH9124485.1 hypothetical protein AeMF1_004761 [Aphanomyces euteiches]KAH9188724.1 hypothetical protein AeNC1_009298 [Aphanomyces euteiches]
MLRAICVLAGALTAVNAAAASCSPNALSALPLIPLEAGPVSLRGVVQADTACIQVKLVNPNATWFALAVAPSTNMINSPRNNAVLFSVHNASAALYALQESAPDGVHYQQDQSSLHVVHSSVVNGTVILTYSRPLAAQSPYDVPIVPGAVTIVNWAIGFTTFPDYHDDQGSSRVIFSNTGVALAPETTTAAPSTTPSGCIESQVAATLPVRLGDGPLSLQSTVVGTSVCLLVTSSNPKLTWFGFSFAPSTNMINTPTNNAMIFLAKNATVNVFDLRDSAPESVLRHANQSASIRVLQVSATQDKVQYLVERSLKAATATDVSISLDQPTIVNWALGTTDFPDYHDIQGSSRLIFSAGGGVIDADVKPPTCNDALLQPYAAVALTDGQSAPSLSLKYLIVGTSVCLQVRLTNPTVTWFALAVSPTANMINHPTNNALVYNVLNGTGHVYDLKDSAPDAVLLSPVQTNVNVIGSSQVNGVVTLTFERSLAATSPTDVAISSTGPTRINWALGFTTFPDYHDVQGSTEILFNQPTLDTSSCSKDALEGVEPMPLGDGPITLQTTIIGDKVCVQATLNDAKATWFAHAVAPTTNMINKPTNNAVIYQLANASAALYNLEVAAPDGVVYAADQSSLRVIESSVVDGKVVLLYERPLAAVTATDVAISTTAPTNVNWAVGYTTFPDYHDVQGSVDVHFEASATTVQVPPTDISTTSIVPTFTVTIAATTFAIMAILGVIATHAGDFTWANHKRVTTPPTSNHFFADVHQTLSDLKLGEIVVVWLYIASLITVAASVLAQFPGATPTRAWALATGHVSLLSLMFILLPVARGEHWEWLFGISHERLIKYHRWLGRLFVIAAAIHLCLNWSLATYARSYGTQQVIPFYGFLAFLSFASMAILAYETIRRKYFEVFYYYHRVVSILGLVFVLLHAQTIRVAMIVPLVVYGATYIWRARAFFNKYQATIQSHLPGTIVLTLPSTRQTKKWAATMNPCSFFWVNVPSVSRLEWHPFSAIVTPDGQSIAFCIKSLQPNTFADQVVAQGKANLVSMTLYVGGPYGKPSVNFTKYDEVILITGGIGVTPMLSLVNQLPHTLPQHTSQEDASIQAVSSINIQFHWVVRSPEELLTAESLMFAAPFPDIVSPRFYVDGASFKTDGSITSNVSGLAVAYTSGRPNLDKIFNAEAYLGKRVCVLVCGPPGLARNVQTYAHNAGFDFHKEVFEY